METWPSIMTIGFPKQFFSRFFDGVINMEPGVSER